jgi:FkbM family methyltransferase
VNLTLAASTPLRASNAVSRYARMIGLYRNWWSVYYNRLKRPTEGNATYRLRSGETFVLGDGIFEARVLNEIWSDKAYEPTSEFVIKSGWNVIDAGAHKGIFAVRAARAGAKVIALEPEPLNFTALSYNLALNSCHRVRTLDAALWSESGEAVLHYFGGDASTNFSLVLGADDGSTDVVQTVTLQSLVEQMGRVDLLKLDIEGAEVAVLTSTPPEALMRIDRIVLDYYIEDAPDEGEGMARAIQALLTPLGFECTIRQKGCIFYAVRRSN